jgi:hypothetical protein
LGNDYAVPRRGIYHKVKEVEKVEEGKRKEDFLRVNFHLSIEHRSKFQAIQFHNKSDPFSLKNLFDLFDIAVKYS